MPLLDRLRQIPRADRDAWVDAQLGLPEAPFEERLPPGGVPYLPCGVDEILAMVEAIPLRPTDRFVDLGSGLGRVAILAHLLSGARAHGIEIQEPLVQLARATAERLGLGDRVTFTCADCAEATFDGTVFFLYAPFNGDLQKRVLARLAQAPRPFVVATVDLDLGHVPWLRARPDDGRPVTIYDPVG